MRGVKSKVKKEEVEKILKLMKSKNLPAATSIKILKDGGEISKSNSMATYIYNLRKTEDYRNILNTFKALKDERDKMLLDLKDKGFTYREIQEKTKLSYDAIYGTFLKYGKVKRLISSRCNSKTSQKKLVEDWNKNYYPGRVPTLQTRKAFEALNLNLDLKC